MHVINQTITMALIKKKIFIFAKKRFLMIEQWALIVKDRLFTFFINRPIIQLFLIRLVFIQSNAYEFFIVSFEIHY